MQNAVLIDLSLFRIIIYVTSLDGRNEFWSYDESHLVGNHFG